MRYVRTVVAVVGLSVTLSASARAQLLVHRDDFDVFHDYATGAVPAGGVWTGVHNATNGSSGGFQAIFQANGVDAFGMPHPGTLFVEDLNGGPFGNGIGFEAGGLSRNTAPMPYQEIDSSLFDWEATVKINDQTAGQWSAAGIVARRAGPPIGVSPLDPSEQFVATYSFRTDADNPGNATILTKNVINGVEHSNANPAFFPGTPPPTAPLPVYIRLRKQGSTFSAQTSLDGLMWSTRTTVTNADLAEPGGKIQVGPSFMMLGGGEGSADFDYFDFIPNPDRLPLLATWKLTGGGNWNVLTNWESHPIPGVPNNDQVEVRFGPAATADATVLTDANVMAQRLVFDNANKYSISGTGTLTLQASTGNASIGVTLGAHEIQTALTLGSNLTLTTQPGTRLDVNNSWNLNSKTVTISGGGGVSVNGNQVTGAGGTLVNSGSTLQGTGTVNGNLQNVSSGTVAPGNSAGTLTVIGNYIQQAGSTMLFEIGGTGPGEFDKLVVGGNLVAAGNLTVQLINGFMPPGGNSFDIHDWSGNRSGTLTLNLPSLSPGLAWNTTSLMTTGVLSVTAAPDADFDNDGDVDGADLLIWQANLGLTGATNAQGDADGNGAVNAADLTHWKGTFGGAVVVSAGAPEPAAAALIAWTLAGLAAVRRRHG
jgi:hypothetical protein